MTPESAWAALPAPVLAATGALAVACFVKVFGIVFLGVPRSAGAREAHESPPLMLVSMAVLAVACVAIGVAPGLFAPALESAGEAWAGQPLPGLAGLAPLGWISIGAAALLGAVALLAAWVIPAGRRARRRQPALPTWDCGYAGDAPSPRLQYTASSFAQIITAHFAWVLRPKVHAPRIRELFAGPARFESHVEDPVLDSLLAPVARRALKVTARMRALPQGQLQRYILYILAVLIPLLIWALAGGSGNG
jgi:hydrogenase-4 component B